MLEQTSMVVETVEKKPGSKVTKKFHGDASKVNVKGPGIKKAFMNRAQNFTVDVKDAGSCLKNTNYLIGYFTRPTF